MLAKAQSRGADALILDFEDAVHPDRKESARTSVLESWENQELDGPAAVCVRINALDAGGQADLQTLVGCPVAAVILPKASGSDDVAQARAAIDATVGPQTGLIPQIETVAGVLDARDVVGGPGGIAAVAFGGEDFAADLGVGRSAGSLELLFPRTCIALWARRIGVPAIDTVFTDLADRDGLVRETRLAAQLGFTGKLLVHPTQVQPVIEVLTPVAADVDHAVRILEAAASSARERDGVVVVDGRMVDAPVVAQAERVVARSRR